MLLYEKIDAGRAGISIACKAVSIAYVSMLSEEIQGTYHPDVPIPSLNDRTNALMLVHG